MPQAVQFEALQRIAADASLSLPAKAILFYALTREPGYRMSVADLTAMSPASDKAIYPRIKELMAAGYVTRKLIQAGCEYTVHVTPITAATEAGA
ncbi:hypothetical protein [Paraburkholderia sp. A1RO-5L]|uniref:hypothetical protein n=1 Tax=Paraburkholderia sp. A1RO-5L TaxID=3028370 RepID=UPI003B764FB3